MRAPRDTDTSNERRVLAMPDALICLERGGNVYRVLAILAHARQARLARLPIILKEVTP